MAAEDARDARAVAACARAAVAAAEAAAAGPPGALPAAGWGGPEALRAAGLARRLAGALAPGHGPRAGPEGEGRAEPKVKPSAAPGEVHEAVRGLARALERERAGAQRACPALPVALARLLAAAVGPGGRWRCSATVLRDCRPRLDAAEPEAALDAAVAGHVARVFAARDPAAAAAVREAARLWDLDLGRAEAAAPGPGAKKRGKAAADPFPPALAARAQRCLVALAAGDEAAADAGALVELSLRTLELSVRTLGRAAEAEAEAEACGLCGRVVALSFATHRGGLLSFARRAHAAALGAVVALHPAEGGGGAAGGPSTADAARDGLEAADAVLAVGGPGLLAQTAAALDAVAAVVAAHCLPGGDAGGGSRAAAAAVLAAAARYAARVLGCHNSSTARPHVKRLARAFHMLDAARVRFATCAPEAATAAEVALARAGELVPSLALLAEAAGRAGAGKRALPAAAVGEEGRRKKLRELQAALAEYATAPAADERGTAAPGASDLRHQVGNGGRPLVAVEEAEEEAQEEAQEEAKEEEEEEGAPAPQAQPRVTERPPAPAQAATGRGGGPPLPDVGDDDDGSDFDLEIDTGE